MYCKNCGKKLKKDENYCPDCGTSTSTEPPKPKVTKTNTKQTSILIIGIIACIFFWIPVLSIPLAIVSIILGINYKKETNTKNLGVILGIISLFLTAIVIILLATLAYFVAVEIEDNPDIQNSMSDFYQDYRREPFDIKGYSYLGDDNSTIYLNKDKTITWYKLDTNKNDNFYTGTYDYYTGDTAIKYIAEKLPEYGLTETEQKNIINSKGETLENYYLIILNLDKVVLEGKEQPTTTKTIYYYGFYNYSRKYLDLNNLETRKQAGFTLKERIKNIDL